ncbi:uncharacterized protein [Ptychodera flava]|uniref:uncharacterized protein isoform X1 n=2 Tax=Ptychodera flava TaxID=63121 RepID=UPI00396A07A9
MGGSGGDGDYDDDQVSFVSEEDNDQFSQETRGLQPYRFEPTSDSVQGQNLLDREDGEEPRIDDDDRDLAQRMGNTNWCRCSCCSVTAKVETNHCCQENERVWEKVLEYRTETDTICSCITLHPGFATVCLDRWVLETAYYQYRQLYGKLKNYEQNEKHRYIAYRQFVRWCWGG